MDYHNNNEHFSGLLNRTVQETKFDSKVFFLIFPCMEEPQAMMNRDSSFPPARFKKNLH